MWPPRIAIGDDVHACTRMKQIKESTLVRVLGRLKNKNKSCMDLLKKRERLELGSKRKRRFVCN